MEAIRFQDDPWRRLPGLTGLALVLTLGFLAGFVRLLELPGRTPGPALVEVQIAELPTAAPVTPPPAPAAKPAPPPPPRPRKEARPKPAPQANPFLPPPPANPAPPREPEPAGPPAPSGLTSVAGPSEPLNPAGLPGGGPPGPAPPAAQLPTQGPARPSPAPQASIPGSPVGVPGGGGRMGARALYKPLPEIPEALRHQNIEVVAVARFRVAASGSAQVDLIEPTSDPDLNRALLESLKRWRFFPAMQDGKPVASTVDIRIPISVR